jgi:L-alanine-DL-glutamate epimerase-like enolase superfamily enzyme
LKITRIESILLQPQWDDPFAARFSTRPLVAIKLHTDAGLTGVSRSWGEPTVTYIRDLLAPVLIGEDPRNVERLWTRMYETSIPHIGQERPIMSAIGAIDVALWDMLGKSTGLPCWQLLGGFRDCVPAYADVPTRAGSPEELGEQLAACVQNGYSYVKFHILRADPDHIVAETRAARRAIGPDVKLMVDVFRALEPHTAVEVARRLEEFDLFWLEEPVRWPDQPLGLAMVARATRIPVAGGEGECSLAGARAILERGGVKYLQTDLFGAGGYTNWRRIAGTAAAFHALIAPHGASNPEINSHLVAAMPHGVVVPATTPGQPPEVWAHLYQNFDIDKGVVRLTDQPGLGLEFDEKFIAKYQIAAVVV